MAQMQTGSNVATGVPNHSERQEPIIVTRELSKRFGDEWAVNKVSLQIPKGSIFGFIGPSGCGKTTTVRLLTGTYLPTSGDAWIFNRQPKKFSRRDRERIGYMPQQFVLYPDLTILENMNFAASIYGIGLFSRGKRIRQLLDFVELSSDRHKLVRNTSGGMMRRLSLACTLIHRPALIFMDEPTTGIDPVLRRRFWDYFDKLREAGTTLFVTTQYVSEAAYCDLVGVMNEGRLILVDTPDGLRKRAHGGELVDMRTVEPIDYPHLQIMRTLPFVTGPVVMMDDRSVRLVVDEASTAMPSLIDWSKEQRYSIESIQEFLPPFDDVFVNLIQRYSNNGKSV